MEIQVLAWDKYKNKTGLLTVFTQISAFVVICA
jgi:hypothetical protein